MPRFLSLYTFSLPLAVLISIPLACTAVITTLVAASILAVRVTFVYIELVLAVVPQYIFQTDDPHSKLSHIFLSPNATYDNSPATTPTIERRSRRLSNTSLMSTLTPAASAVSLPLPQQSVGLGRDFEGVGGWRLDQQSDEEQLWTRINSRLELPAESPRRYHHQRSLTAGSYSGDRERNRSPELTMRRNGSFSPNTKRIRTPTLTRNGFTSVEGYFGMAAAQERAMGGSPTVLRTPASTRRNSVSPKE